MPTNRDTNKLQTRSLDRWIPVLEGHDRDSASRIVLQVGRELAALGPIVDSGSRGKECSESGLAYGTAGLAVLFASLDNAGLGTWKAPARACLGEAIAGAGRLNGPGIGNGVAGLAVAIRITDELLGTNHRGVVRAIDGFLIEGI